MKNLLVLAFALLTFELSAGVLLAQAPTQSDSHLFHKSAPGPSKTDVSQPTSPALSTFEKLKTLVGEWEAREGTAYGGRPIRVSYKVVSKGTSVLENYYQYGSDFIDMMTLYHLDGDSLALTHFCAVNNQVRMRADPLTADGNVLRFNFVDAANLSVSNKEVAIKLEITFTDKDHMTQLWFWRLTDDKGKSIDKKHLFNFTRRQ